jgi:replicative DNA helicase
VNDTTEVAKQLICALLTYPDTIPEVAGVIGEKKVMRHNYQVVYSKIIDLWDKKEHVDSFTVAAGLDKKLYDFVLDISLLNVSPGSAGTYAKILVENYLRNAIATYGTEVVYMAKNSETDTFELLEACESKIFKISSSIMRKNFATPKDIAESTFLYIQDRSSGLGTKRIQSGFSGLDRILGGFNETDFLLLAARPSVGKTALAIDIADNIVRDGFPVGVFSLEMSAKQLVMRTISKHTGISAHRMNLGIITDNELNEISYFLQQYQKLPVFIDDTGGIHINELKAKARRLKAEANIGLLVVDYLQLITVSKKDSGTREQEVGTISRALKALAKELNIPILCLSQLSRAIESRDDKTPRLSDLRESGSLEQDSDIVVFIHSEGAQDGERKILVAKHRNGPLGEVTLNFESSYSRFKEKTVEVF